MSHVFRAKSFIFDIQIQNGYRQNTNKSDFYACDLQYHEQHLFIGNLKNRLRDTSLIRQPTQIM